MLEFNVLQEKYFQIYKREITIREFESWIYENESIGQTSGEELYFKLISIDYNSRDALNELKKIMFPVIDHKEVKVIMILEIMKDLIIKYFDKELNRDEIANKLVRSIDIAELDEYNDELLNDCFFALYHMNEDGFETTELEIQYLNECFNEIRTFSRAERDEYIKKR